MRHGIWDLCWRIVLSSTTLMSIHDILPEQEKGNLQLLTLLHIFHTTNIPRKVSKNQKNWYRLTDLRQLVTSFLQKGPIPGSPVERFQGQTSQTHCSWIRYQSGLAWGRRFWNSLWLTVRVNWDSNVIYAKLRAGGIAVQLVIHLVKNSAYRYAFSRVEYIKGSPADAHRPLD